MAIQLWATFGMSVLIFLAGLSTVNEGLIEAAHLDGAKPLPIWRHVIMPSLRPIHEFVAVITTIGLLTAGVPGTATTLPEFLIWLEQGKMNRPGYAAALSMGLFAVMTVLAWVQIGIMSRNASL